MISPALTASEADHLHRGLAGSRRQSRASPRRPASCCSPMALTTPPPSAPRPSSRISARAASRSFPCPSAWTEPDDVSIRNIVMQEVAFSGDSVPVQVQLLSKGYEKRTAKLTITAQRPPGLPANGCVSRAACNSRTSISTWISTRRARPGSRWRSSRLTTKSRWPTTAIERSIRVVNEKVNVLYIEGNNRWEFRYLSAILKRDPRLNTTFIASSAGPEFARNSPEYIERFPSKREEAFKYDLVILGDVDAAFFTPEELGLLEELIRDRGRLAAGALRPDAYAHLLRRHAGGNDAAGALRSRGQMGTHRRVRLSGAHPRGTQQHGHDAGERTRGKRPDLEPRRAARSPPAAHWCQARRHRAGHAFRCHRRFPALPDGRMAPLRHRQVPVAGHRPALAPALQDRRQIPLARLVADASSSSRFRA